MKQKKTHFKKLLIFGIAFMLASCSEYDTESHSHHSHSNTSNDEISFKQFKNETGITKFDYLKKANIIKSTDFQARNIESEFITDTIGIKKYVNPTDNKTTYSFKIYPLSEDLNAKEYYNLVYEKIGTEWNEIIFFNTEKANPTDARTLESSEMVYNRISGREGFTEEITYSVHCNGSCTGACDGFACPTGECIRTTITYTYTGIQDSGSGNNGIPTGTGSGNNGNSGGGSDDYLGIYIPNSYDGDADLNNPDFIFAGQVYAYTNSLPNNLKDIMQTNFWFFHNIKDFFKNNGGLTKSNKDSVEYSLSNILAIFTTISQNANDLTTIQINQTKQAAFLFLLQHGAWLVGQSALTQLSILLNLSSLEKIEKMDELADYMTLNPSVLWNDINESYFSPYPEIENFIDINPDNITYETPLTSQNLPSLASFKNNFPKNGTNGNYTQMSPTDVYNLVGGSLLNSFNNNPNNYSNGCTVRGSRGLLYSNIQIPVLIYSGSQRTQKGGDLKNYILDAKSFNKFMIDKFGDTTHKLEGAAANDPTQVMNLLSGKNGIYVIINNNSSPTNGAGYSGHVDLILNGNCIGNEYLGPTGGVKSIRIWTLN